MHLVILGATGGMGLQIVQKAIEKDHSVTAIARSIEQLKPFGDRITVRQRNLLNVDELAEGIQDHDGVLSALAHGCLSQRLYANYGGLYAQKNATLNSDGTCCVGFGFPARTPPPTG